MRTKRGAGGWVGGGEGHPNDEYVAEAVVEDDLDRDTGVGAAEDGHRRMLRPGALLPLLCHAARLLLQGLNRLHTCRMMSARRSKADVSGRVATPIQNRVLPR